MAARFSCKESLFRRTVIIILEEDFKAEHNSSIKTVMMFLLFQLEILSQRPSTSLRLKPWVLSQRFKTCHSPRRFQAHLTPQLISSLLRHRTSSLFHGHWAPLPTNNSLKSIKRLVKTSLCQLTKLQSSFQVLKQVTHSRDLSLVLTMSCKCRPKILSVKDLIQMLSGPRLKLHPRCLRHQWWMRL